MTTARSKCKKKLAQEPAYWSRRAEVRFWKKVYIILSNYHFIVNVPFKLLIVSMYPLNY